jgi:hypothetical protein
VPTPDEIIQALLNGPHRRADGTVPMQGRSLQEAQTASQLQEAGYPSWHANHLARQIAGYGAPRTPGTVVPQGLLPQPTGPGLPSSGGGKWPTQQ